MLELAPRAPCSRVDRSQILSKLRAVARHQLASEYFLCAKVMVDAGGANAHAKGEVLEAEAVQSPRLRELLSQVGGPVARTFLFRHGH